MCLLMSTHCLVQGCLCCSASTQGLSVSGGLHGAGSEAPMPESCYPNPSAPSHLTDKRLIHRVGRRRSHKYKASLVALCHSPHSWNLEDQNLNQPQERWRDGNHKVFVEVNRFNSVNYNNTSGCWRKRVCVCRINLMSDKLSGT